MKPKKITPALPEPNELTVSGEDRTKAAQHMANLEAHLIWYVRGRPIVAKMDDRYKMVRSAPTGVVIAFKDEEGKVHIGWSRRHTGKVKDPEGNIIGEIEPAPFTKKSALHTAFLRGILDSVIINPKTKSSKTGSGVILPKDIARILPRFIDYAAYRPKMDGEVANVTVNV